MELKGVKKMIRKFEIVKYWSDDSASIWWCCWWIK